MIRTDMDAKEREELSSKKAAVAILREWSRWNGPYEKNKLISLRRSLESEVHSLVERNNTENKNRYQE